MKDELIINGKKCVHTPEVKEDRLIGYAPVNNYNGYDVMGVSINKIYSGDIRMIEIREGEIIVSELELKRILGEYLDNDGLSMCLKELGFKGDSRE